MSKLSIRIIANFLFPKIYDGNSYREVFLNPDICERTMLACAAKFE